MTKFQYTYKIAVLVMTEIVLVHDQKHVWGHYISVDPNASPKRTPEQTILQLIIFLKGLH